MVAGWIFLASPADAQWRALGLSGRNVNRLYAHGGFLYACTRDGLHRLSLAEPDTVWSPIGFAGQSVLDLVALGPTTFLAAKGLTTAPADTVSLFRSVDGGATWQPFQNGFGAGSDRRARRLLAFSTNPDTLVATSSRIEKSTDGGLSWRVVREAAIVNALESSPANPRLLWVGGETMIFSPYIFSSADAGESWVLTSLDAGGDNAVDAIAGHPMDPDIVYLGMEGRVMKTEDGGASWTTVTSPNPSMYTFGLAIRPFLPLKLYAAGAVNIPDPRGVVFFQSLNGGLSWDAFSYPAWAGNGVHHLLLRVGADQETLYAATGNGVYRYAQVTVDVPARGGPEAVALQCRPNPFRGETAIEFSLAGTERVSLHVLDVEGRMVATLLDGTVEAGTCRVRWDARNVGSGLYLGRLQVGRQIRRLKMLRIR